jgi:hypothetical protein
MLIFVALHDPRHVHLIDEFRYPDAETGKWVTLAWHAYFVDYNVGEPIARLGKSFDDDVIHASL